MKKFTLLSIVAATVLFTGCGEDTKKSATEAAPAATETTANAVDAAKEAAAKAAEAAKAKAAEVAAAAKAAAQKAAETKAAAEAKAAKAAQALKDRAAAATQAAKETAAEATEAVKQAAGDAVNAAAEATGMADNAAGKAVFAKCAGCHGADGKTKALGKSAAIAGEAAADIESKLHEYKAGTRNTAGMGMLMKGQVAGLSDEDIKAVAAYISSL